MASSWRGLGQSFIKCLSLSLLRCDAGLPVCDPPRPALTPGSGRPRVVSRDRVGSGLSPAGRPLVCPSGTGHRGRRVRADQGGESLDREIQAAGTCPLLCAFPAASGGLGGRSRLGWAWAQEVPSGTNKVLPLRRPLPSVPSLGSLSSAGNSSPLSTQLAAQAQLHCLTSAAAHSALGPPRSAA